MKRIENRCVLLDILKSLYDFRPVRLFKFIQVQSRLKFNGN